MGWEMAPLIGMCDIIDSGYSCFAKRADIMSSAICDNVIERTSGALDNLIIYNGGM